MKIEKEGYTIRPWQIQDTEPLAKYLNNINIWNNLRDSLPFPYTKENAETFISMNLNDSNPKNFAIVVDGEAVGGIGIIPKQDIERLSAEIGYWLAEPFWGKGIVSSVIKDYSKYIFENTEIIRLFAITFDNNIASQRVLEKAGFTKLCIMHKAAVKNGRVMDIPYYELVKNDL